MRISIARDGCLRRWAPMIGTPTCTPSSSSLRHICSCSLPPPLDPSAEPNNIRVSGLPSAGPTMLDEAQKARMAQNREQALYRLRSKQYFVSKAPHDALGMPPKNGGAQYSSFPGVTNFLYGQKNGHIQLNNLQDIRDTQHQYNFLNAPNNGVFENCANVEGLQPVVGSTNVAMQKSEQLESGSSISMQEFDYVVVIDFEATCDKNMASLKPQEIIEFPSVLVDCQQLTLRDSFQTYVKPVHHPILTEFCTHLTGIQQEQVDKGMPLAEAIYLHDKWLEQNGIKDKNFAVLIWSDWDCKIMLDSECKLKGLDKPQYFDRWINLKALFQGAFNGKKCNLRKAVEASGLQWMGRAHCGLDDARNTARLALELMRRGTILKVTGSMDSEAVVAEVRRPEWPGAVPQGQLTGELSGTDVQSSNGSATGNFAQEIDMLQCFCGVTCKKHVVKKPGPTQGKNFFACGRWTPAEGSRCGFFKWAAS